MSEYIDLSQAASYLTLSKSMLYKWTMAKTVPHYKVGRRVVFKPEELKRWFEDNFKVKVEEYIVNQRNEKNRR